MNHIKQKYSLDFAAVTKRRIYDAINAGIFAATCDVLDATTHAVVSGSTANAINAATTAATNTATRDVIDDVMRYRVKGATS